MRRQLRCMLPGLAMVFLVYAIMYPTVEAQPQSAILRIKSRISRNSNTRWRGRTGSNSKDVYRAMNLDITVVNSQQRPTTFNLEWYFFTKGASAGGSYDLFDFGHEQLAMKKGEMKKLTKVSQAVHAREERYYSYYHRLYSKYKKGLKIKGFIVYVRGKGNAVIQTEASPRDLMTLARDPAMVEKMKNDMSR